MSEFIHRYTGLILILFLVVLGFTGNLISGNLLVIAAQILGIALVISARIAFGRQRFNVSSTPAGGPLLRKGPYRIIRHPMYSGAMLFFLATILDHLSMLTAVIGVIVLIALPWRVYLEEVLLRAAYPDYADYASKTYRMIPFLY